MLQAQLYFLSDQYYQDFPDDKLMQNKDIINGIPHNRPCFFAFKDSKVASIYWIVPISLRFEKFKRIEQNLTAYIDKNNCPIRIDNRVANDVEKNARNVLAMAKRGAKVIFPDIFKIYHELEQQLQQNDKQYDRKPNIIVSVH